MMEALWAKRIGPHCVDCQFYEPDWASEADGDAVGTCHRLPPREWDADDREAKFPYVSSSDWCGEFKLEAEKAASFAKHVADILDGKP